MTRRIVVNLAAFTVVVVVLLAYGVFDLLGNPFASPTVVHTVFPSASGVSAGFPVTWNGVDIGAVRSVSLAKGGARVAMTIDPGAHVPSTVEARIDIANDLGEQQVDLVPLPPSGKADPPLKNGATIPAAPGSSPAQIGQVVTLATNLLKSIPVGSLNKLLGELSVSLQGRASDFRTLINAGQAFANEVLTYQSAFKSLLANSPPVLNTLHNVGTQLRQSLDNTAILANVLATERYHLVHLLTSGANAASDVNTLVSNRGADLACLIHDLGSTASNLSQPRNFANLNAALGLNNYFFGAIKGVTQFGPAIALAKGSPASSHQGWLRTRILFPPVYPQGQQYSNPTELPPVKPGAACITELGNGVSGATQPGFVAYGTSSSPAGRLEPASHADAVVTGTGPSPSGSSLSSYKRAPVGFTRLTLPLLLVVLLVGMAGLLVGLGENRTVRIAKMLARSVRGPADRGSGLGSQLSRQAEQGRGGGHARAHGRQR
ncbi:MAG: MCE family protein [Acidimicrobiales bacterium]